MCVSVFVCKRERERERERASAAVPMAQPAKTQSILRTSATNLSVLGCTCPWQKIVFYMANGAFHSPNILLAFATYPPGLQGCFCHQHPRMQLSVVMLVLSSLVSTFLVFWGKDKEQLSADKYRLILHPSADICNCLDSLCMRSCSLSQL